MKHLSTLFICASLALSLTGCGSETSSPNKNTSSTTAPTVGSILADAEKENATTPSTENTTDSSDTLEETIIPTPSTPPDDFLDLESTTPLIETSAPGDVLDLTTLSSTMVYGEVFNMLNNPDAYIGKTIKMEGQFNIFQNIMTEQVYTACIISDAAACCSEGIEFVLAGDAVYPDDYPELTTPITVTGTFETYEEDGMLYCHLVDAVMTIQ